MYNSGCFCMEYQKEEFSLTLFYYMLPTRFDDACEVGRGAETIRCHCRTLATQTTLDAISDARPLDVGF
jgi:hypothetical protein